MKFSIVTPTLNQVEYIRETIESILSQEGDFELEYWVIDGGSTDGTLNILKEYKTKLSNNKRIKFDFISEKDNGMSEAINKGLKYCSGEIISYLNSDDFYLPDTLAKVEQAFRDHQETKWLTGYCRIIDKKGKPIQGLVMKYRNFWLRHYTYFTLKVLNFIPQPATFWRRELVQEIGVFNENLGYTMDYDYWLSAGAKSAPIVLKEDLAVFRIHNQSKGGSQYQKQFVEDYQTVKRHCQNSWILFLHRLHNYFITSIYKLIK
jgi:glycosyltransferase involved in cell wall biosynthesis